MKCRKKPIIFNCVQIKKDNRKEVSNFLSKYNSGYTWDDKHTGFYWVRCGNDVGQTGDYVIEDAIGRCYICPKFVFEKTYEIIEE